MSRFAVFSCYNDRNLLKQLPFYEKTIKRKIKKITNAKLLSELPFFKNP